jgi:hypothetical protein
MQLALNGASHALVTPLSCISMTVTRCPWAHWPFPFTFVTDATSLDTSHEMVRSPQSRTPRWRMLELQSTLEFLSEPGFPRQMATGFVYLVRHFLLSLLQSSWKPECHPSSSKPFISILPYQFFLSY